MALLIKNQQGRFPNATGAGQATIEQWIQVSTAGRALPQTSTDVLFKVIGGRVRVKLVLAEVTTILQSSDPVLKLSSQKVVAAAVVGTAIDLASTVDVSSHEVGGFLVAEGDGTALVKSNAGNAFLSSGLGQWVAPIGEIYITTGASKTGAYRWDLWYQPLDVQAYVQGTAAAATKT